MTPISFFLHGVDVAEARGVVVGQRLLEQQTAGRGLERVGLAAADGLATHRDERMQVQAALVDRTQHFPQVTEHAAGADAESARLSVR
jgi:hypothetical protein